MSATLLLEAGAPAARRAHDHGVTSSGGRVTLEQRLERAHQALRAKGTAECPVCHGSMTRGAAGGICRGCGARLE